VAGKPRHPQAAEMAGMKKKRITDQWTARRAMRMIGAGAIIIILIMAFLGVFVLDLTTSALAFFIYWSAFFLLLLLAIGIAMLDAVATIGKFKNEHAKLRSFFQQELEEQDSNQQRSETEP
jgi:cobalamin biosynthesis protein CobD/CbiB